MLLVLISIVTILAIICVFPVKEKHKGNVVLSSVLINAAISSFFAFKAISGNVYEINFYAGSVLDNIRITIDSLSGWFILLMNFTVITAILYGKRYLLHYQDQRKNLNLHYISFLLNHFAMISIYSVQNMLAFLCVWEVMAVSAFLLVIFENWKTETIKAGINYLIQSHISIILLYIGVMWVHGSTGSYDFSAISIYSSSAHPALSFLLFLTFFVGFAIKAGFVPFHTWLPHAHPAAPSHISGMMSGVIIKLGIFGILRIILLINRNFLEIGYFILAISLISGLYGVMLAIVQHNLKKLLAYHSIENIGIIGIGIGIGAIGLGYGNNYLAFAGFAGALLHTLNHSLFKSLLFYCAGNVYQVLHTLNIDSMGGLIKKMKKTAVLFLIAALAICGLPPFNGFISEFLIYLGLFEGISFTNQLGSTSVFILSVVGLVLIGGLAILCFTKAFGIIFLGEARTKKLDDVTEAENSKLFPKYLIVLMILAIGLFPQLFINLLKNPVNLLSGNLNCELSHSQIIYTLQNFSIGVFAFIILIILILGIKKLVTGKKEQSVSPTWGCGYVAPNSKMQYSASSFVKSYRKLIQPLIQVKKQEEKIDEIIPNTVHSESHLYDKIETNLIEKPLKKLTGFLGKFNFLQNGSVQFYVLYGIFFIFLIIAIPLLIDAAVYVFELIKKL